MSISFEKVADRVFRIVKGSGRTVELFDNEGTKVFDPLKARRIFAQPDAVMITLTDAGENSSLQVSLGDGTDIDKIERLLQSLRTTAAHFNLSWVIKRFSHKLSPKDFSYQADIARDAQLQNEGQDMNKPVVEGMTGSSRSSYQQIGDARVIVRHAAPVDDTVIGARGRNIKEIFVENGVGERFRMPTAHLGGARAMARHVDCGGDFRDAVGERILGLVREFRNLRGVTGYIRENASAVGDMAEARVYGSFATNRMTEINETLRRLGGARGYARTVESLNEATAEVDDSQIEGEVNRIIDILGIEDGNEPFMEGVRSLARHSIRFREPSRADLTLPKSDADLDDDAGIDYEDVDVLKDKKARDAAGLPAVLAALMGDPATLDFNPDLLLFSAGKSKASHEHGRTPPTTFKSMTDEITIKLGALAQAVTNDALSVYLSRIHDKLQHDLKLLTADEKKHMARALTVAAKADPRLKLVTLPKKAPVRETDYLDDVAVEGVDGMMESVEVPPVSLDGELFASLATWMDGFSPERVLAETFTPPQFATPQGNQHRDRFAAGDTVKLIPTPEINRGAFPEASWLKEATTATLKNPAIKGTPDLCEVELEDGTVKTVYGFNIADAADKKAEGVIGEAVRPTALAEDAVWETAAALAASHRNRDAVRAALAGLSEADRGRVLATVETLWETPVIAAIRGHIAEDVATASGAELADAEAGIEDALTGSDGLDEAGGVLSVADTGDLLAAERILQNAGLMFDLDAETNTLRFAAAEDAQEASALLDGEGIPHSGLDEADDLSGEGTLDEDATAYTLGGDMEDDLLADVSTAARMEHPDTTPAIHSAEHSLHVGGESDARRAMQVLDDAGLSYTAYAPGRFEFAAAGDKDEAVAILDAAGIAVDPVLESRDGVTFMQEMRKRLHAIML